MEEEDLNGSLIDVNLFRDKPFYPYKNYSTAHLEKIYHVPTLPTKIANYNAMKAVINHSSIELKLSLSIR